MKEAGQSPTLHDSPFTPYHHHFGISALETLPEEDGDDEEDSHFRSRSISPDVTWSPPRVQGHSPDVNRDKLTKNGADLMMGLELERETRSDMQPTIRHEIERQRAKVLLLEGTIRQLQDELRESKDQNELLEFRLLELGDLDVSPPSNPVNEVSLGKRCNNRRKSEDSSEDDGGVEALDSVSGTSQGGSVYGEGDGAEVSSEVTGHEERSNGHASVAEARSSCSDCSESLSFQESGIFEAQYPDDSYIPSSSTSRRSQEDVSRELGRLLSQIEALVTRFHNAEDAENCGDKGVSEKIPRSGRILVQHRSQRSDPDDLSYEFLFCRQRLQEFGRKLSKFGNVEYVQGLEAKISDLLNESQKLEEEKAEMEEAENDSRNMCQRLEEKVKRMKVKKGNLVGLLNQEQRFLESLRLEVLRLQAKEDELTTRNSLLETTLQSQEQLNFDLEESLIELKDSVQFLLSVIPVFLAWYSWNAKTHRHDVKPPPVFALPPSSSPFTKTEFAEIGIQTSPELFSSPLSSHRGKVEEKTLWRGQNNWAPAENELLEKIRDLEQTVARRTQDLEISQKKLTRVREEWEFLIKELEDFEMECPRKNPNDILPVTRLTPGPTTTKCRQGSLVANRIRSLFPEAKNPSPPDLPPKPEILPKFEMSQKPEILPKPDILPKSKTVEIISALRHKFAENLHRMMIESREKVEHDGWRLSKDTREIKSPEILHLAAEVNRLEILLGEQEGKNDGRLVELETEAAILRSELKMSTDLKKKMEESQLYATRMMNRVEELELAEMSWKEEIGHHEKREKKNKESITWLRSEVELLTAKCGSLQDEIDTRIRAENLYKQEISVLQSQFREAERIMQDKETLLLDSSTDFRAQISKLESQVDEAREELGDLECSNGMLKEEVLYLERVVTEVSERGEQNEKLVQILTSKLQDRENQIGLLKKEVSEGRRDGGPRLPYTNDLGVFARNDGGLMGVCRDVQDVMAVVNNCTLCKCAGGRKLGEVSEQLTTLTSMLEGSQRASSIYGMNGHQLSNLSLSRCESEEHLSSPASSTAQSTLAKWSHLVVGGPIPVAPYQRCQVEEHKNLGHLESELVKKEDEIRKLTEKRRILSCQLKGLEEMRLMREKDLRESHLNESWWWKLRCDEKNELIQILARRITHLCATNSQGTYVLDEVCRDISKIGASYPVGPPLLVGEGHEEIPLDATSLTAYFQAERCRILEILESSSCNCNLTDLTHSPPVNMDFRVLRRIGEDALLLSWCTTPHSSQHFQGYEICVNGESHLRVPNPVRCKALLLGLNMAEPLQLSLKFWSSDLEGLEEVRCQQESSITYIA